MSNTEKIEYITADDLIPFKNHPFKSRDGEEKERLLQSIKEQGTIEPLIVRPSVSEGKYEIISGHRRMEVCKELGMKNILTIVKHMSDEEAAVMVADANIHRENILPSEKAFAYRLKMEVLGHQGKLLEPASRQLVGKSETADLISDTDSGRQVQRYIRLTHLIPELLAMVDEGRIAFTPAVCLSYLNEIEQQDLYEAIQELDATPNLSQAQRFKKMSEEAGLTPESIYAILSQEKANQKECLKIPVDRIRKYFPKSYTASQIEEDIVKMCETRYKKRIRDKDFR